MRRSLCEGRTVLQAGGTRGASARRALPGGSPGSPAHPRRAQLHATPRIQVRHRANATSRHGSKQLGSAIDLDPLILYGGAFGGGSALHPSAPWIRSSSRADTIALHTACQVSLSPSRSLLRLPTLYPHQVQDVCAPHAPLRAAARPRRQPHRRRCRALPNRLVV